MRAVNVRMSLRLMKSALEKWLIRVDPTQTGDPSRSGPTLVPACLMKSALGKVRLLVVHQMRAVNVRMSL